MMSRTNKIGKSLSVKFTQIRIIFPIIHDNYRIKPTVSIIFITFRVSRQISCLCVYRLLFGDQWNYRYVFTLNTHTNGQSFLAWGNHANLRKKCLMPQSPASWVLGTYAYMYLLWKKVSCRSWELIGTDYPEHLSLSRFVTFHIRKHPLYIEK